MTPRLLIRSGAAASVVVHLALLGLVLVMAEVHPFAAEQVETIAVDVVTPEEAPPAPAATPPPVEPPATPSLADASPPPPQPAPPAAAKPPKQTASQPTPAQPAPAPQAKPAAAPPVQAAAPPRSEAAAPQPPPTLPPAIPQEPDVTVKYSVLLGLPPGTDFDAPAETQANIGPDIVAALRRHLKSCAPLPATLSPTDPVRIVMRVSLAPDGRLTRPPDLIEASASAKGPALMRGAIDALTKCQPFTMLPADKYQEWKVLDLDFKPEHFRGG